MPTIAAIDLGSNAMRASIAVTSFDNLEVITNLRIPLRLGEDVFTTGSISKEKISDTERAFVQALHLFAKYKVSQVAAKATSALREAKNRMELVDKVRESTGIIIEMISGQEEARMIFNAVQSQFNFKDNSALIMDIGGGSTEFIAVKDNRILGMHSFDIGTIRLLQFTDQEELHLCIDTEVQKMLLFATTHFGQVKPDLFIGTGGNLRRIGKIRKKNLGQSSSQVALFKEISSLEELILSMPICERIKQLGLDQNKADVILPAISLTKAVMKELQLEMVQLPKVGLKEGILLSMLKEPTIKLISEN